MNLDDGVNNKVFRKRDFAFICIVLLAIYLSLDTTTFTYRLQPAWYFDQRSIEAFEPWAQLPPLVVDLDGDDRKEIVFITKDQFLKVLRAEPSSELKEDIYAPDEVASTPLSTAKGIKGRHPVALTAGYIESYSEKKSRKKVIVVVRDDLTVLCYDESLELLWEKAVAHKGNEIDTLIDKFSVDQISLIVSPLSIKEGVTGTIILGVSMQIKPEYEDHFKIEEGIDMSASGGIEHPEMEARAKLEHFSLFALNGHNGHVIWKHDGLEVKAEQYTKSLPQHAYKLEAGTLARQLHGTSDWTVFKQSLINELPHDWHSSLDTSLRFAHFVRRHIGADSMNQMKKPELSVKEKNVVGKRGTGQLLSGKSKFLGVESPPLAMSATLPHDAAEHTEHPNVIVAHTKKGLEVIALKTGFPITSLALTQGQSFADLNGDGMVDSLLVLENADDVATHGKPFAHEGGELQHCTVMALSGLPPRSQLFNGTLCHNHRSLQDPLSKKSKLPVIVTAASPLILKTLDPRTMRESKFRDVIVAINIGYVTCYSGDGTFKWQTKGAPNWDLKSNSKSLLAFDFDAIRVDELGTHDNRHAQILLLGDSSIALVSRDGTIEAHAEVPTKAIAIPTLGDFDNDFITDVIIITEEAVLGYRLEVTASIKGMLIAFIILAIVALVVFLLTLRSEMIPNARTGIARRSYSTKRSTDEYHID